MIKIIIVTILLLLFIQFVLYYCNVDLFKMYIKKDSQSDSRDSSSNILDESKEHLKTLLNELKQ